MLYIDDIVPVCCVEPGKEEAACVDLDGEWAENSKVLKGGGVMTPQRLPSVYSFWLSSPFLFFSPIWTERNWATYLLILLGTNVLFYNNEIEKYHTSNHHWFFKS